MIYFQNCKTKDEVKALFRDLAKINHPDRGGNTATMQTINAEYAFAIAKVLRGENLTADEVESEILNSQQYQDAINAIINLQDINIEVCGGWIWVSGNTYEHRAIFKAHGFYFASVKKMWYFRSVDYKTSNKASHTMEEIRTKYGSHVINTFTFKALAS